MASSHVVQELFHPSSSFWPQIVGLHNFSCNIISQVNNSMRDLSKRMPVNVAGCLFQQLICDYKNHCICADKIASVATCYANCSLSSTNDSKFLVMKHLLLLWGWLQNNFYCLENWILYRTSNDCIMKCYNFCIFL